MVGARDSLSAGALPVSIADVVVATAVNFLCWSETVVLMWNGGGSEETFCRKSGSIRRNENDLSLGGRGKRRCRRGGRCCTLGQSAFVLSTTYGRYGECVGDQQLMFVWGIAQRRR